jgi:hypothetical protein
MIARENAGLIFVLIALFAVFYLYMMPVPEYFVDAGHCGVDLPSCQQPMRCINGYCKSDNPPSLSSLMISKVMTKSSPTMPPISDLPIRPGLVGFSQTRL